MKTEQKSDCPVCSSNAVEPVLEINDIPIYCNVLWPSEQAAFAAKKGDIQLSVCNDCGHLYNKSFDPDLMDYTEEYENSLHCSPRFQSYADNLVSRLVEQHGLKEKSILEIACGKGDFLKLLCKTGNNKGIGFDPSYVSESFSVDDGPNITFIKDYFSKDKISGVPDLVCCRHALEHIQMPTEFLSGLRQELPDGKNILLFFEVPNSLYTIRDLGIWDLIYEHCSYFWEGSLQRSFELSGFKVGSSWEDFEGQFLCIEAFLHKDDTTDRTKESSRLQELSTLVSEFSTNYHNKFLYWEECLEKLKYENKKTVVWGAGSKGITFLNTLKSASSVEYIVDINSKKQGKFSPGTAQKVVPPEFLKSYKPDIVILMNQIYENEIVEILKRLGLDAEILIA